jgi:IclR family pca regulon transcriptional regulator
MKADRDFVASLARGLNVIHAFANQHRELSIARVSQRAGITRAAARRYLHTLAALGYARTTDGTHYTLLPKVASIAQAYISANPLPGAAQPHLDRLAERVGEACSLAVLDGAEIMYLARAKSSSVMSPRFNVGGRLPAHCTSIGHVLLSWLPESEQQQRLHELRLIPYTTNTIAAAGELSDCLARARSAGYAIADQQLEPGFRSIAVPVLRGTQAVAGINVIVPVAHAAISEMAQRYLEPLLDAAADIGAALNT